MECGEVSAGGPGPNNLRILLARRSPVGEATDSSAAGEAGCHVSCTMRSRLGRIPSLAFRPEESPFLMLTIDLGAPDEARAAIGCIEHQPKPMPCQYRHEQDRSGSKSRRLSPVARRVRQLRTDLVFLPIDFQFLFFGRDCQERHKTVDTSPPEDTKVED